MMRRISIAAIVAAALFANAGIAQAQQDDTIQRLRFLMGTWHCTGTMPGPAATPYTATRSYSFPTTGPWMQEILTMQANGGQPQTIIQMWGAKNAYAFMPGGVETKRVVGWNGNNFLARSDNPTYTLALYGNAQSIEWTMGYPNGSSSVETCKR
jgi:hypothetical protein